MPVINIRQRQNIFCGTFVFLTDEREEYSGNSFGTPSQKNEHGPEKKRGCRIVVTGTVSSFISGQHREFEDVNYDRFAAISAVLRPITLQ